MAYTFMFVESVVHQLLVVVDDFDNCQNQVAQAIRLANLLNSDVHLLHTLRPGIGSNRLLKARAALMDLQGKMIPQLRRGHMLHSQCTHSDPYKFIRQYCDRYVIDLLLMQHFRPHPWSRLFNRMNIETLAVQLNCPVMNIPATHPATDFKNIILPVTDQLPLRKLHFANFFTDQQPGTIYLVADENCSYLQKTKQLLAENTHLQVRMLPLQHKNIAASSISYARQLHADLILVQPGNESRLPGVMNQLFHRFIFSASPIPVMAV